MRTVASRDNLFLKVARSCHSGHNLATGFNAQKKPRALGYVNPVDAYVGVRLRARRMLLDLTQDDLAGYLGLTFQQIQKYENGANRISASRLHQLATILRVRVGYFFDGYGEIPDKRQQDQPIDLMERRETMELVRVFYSLPKDKRDQLRHFIDTFSA